MRLNIEILAPWLLGKLNSWHTWKIWMFHTWTYRKFGSTTKEYAWGVRILGLHCHLTTDATYKGVGFSVNF